MDVSVLIPTYNRASLLPKVLDAWREVDKATRYEYEIIFSDDGSSDNTIATLKEHGEGLPIVVLDNEHGGPARARNSAIGQARGDKILIVGDDIFPNPQFVNQHHELSLQHGPETAILGEVKWHPDLELNYLMTHITEVGHEQFSFNAFPPNTYVDFRHFYTSNISVDRKLLLSEKVLFDERFYKVNFEDVELGYRLSQKGMKILFEPKAYGDHYHPYTIDGFCKRQESAGEMAVVLTRLHPELERVVGVQKTWERYARFRVSRLDKIPTLNGSHTDFDAVIKLCESYERALPNAMAREQRYIKLALSSIYSRLFRVFLEIGMLNKLEPDNQDYKEYLSKVYFDAGGFWDCYIQAFDTYKDLSESDRLFRESVLINQCLLTRGQMQLGIVDGSPELVQSRELVLARKELDRITKSYAWLIGSSIVYPAKVVKNVIRKLVSGNAQSASQTEETGSQDTQNRAEADEGIAKSRDNFDPLYRDVRV
jgi:glycosyltransferase involved in cell wall biosynthesis